MPLSKTTKLAVAPYTPCIWLKMLMASMLCHLSTAGEVLSIELDVSKHKVKGILEINTVSSDRYVLIQVLGGLNDLRKKGHFCDVTLCVDGQTFPVHRSVLASFSPYFRVSAKSH